MTEKIEPISRAEQEITGYRDVFALVHESYEYMRITLSVILQMHAMLHRYSGHAFAGHWKDSDNSIVGRDADGIEHIRFRSLPAVAVPEAMEELCASYAASIESETVDPLILVARFIFDFVNIHPFADGNGRMSRILTLLLLYQNGYLTGKYVSIEDESDRARVQDAPRRWQDRENRRRRTGYILAIAPRRMEAHRCAARASKTS